jgi:signal recognition particle GTPase
MLSTAWDFLLLRMPEIQLMYGTVKDTTFSYVCSADRAVQKLGRLFTIELVSNQAQIPSIISLKHKEISQDLGKKVANTLCSKLQEQSERRQVNLILNEVNPVLKEKLEGLVSNLEDQVRVLCKQ